VGESPGNGINLEGGRADLAGTTFNIFFYWGQCGSIAKSGLFFHQLWVPNLRSQYGLPRKKQWNSHRH